VLVPASVQFGHGHPVALAVITLSQTCRRRP
jgi:hypothetical protein